MDHVSSFKIESIMENINYRAVFALVTGITFAASQPILAEEASSQKRMNPIEEVFVLGKRRAYQGNFDKMEVPAANQLINEDLLKDVAAISLDDALDLSASVARQNNFGGLWNSFSVRGFAGDINLPSGFLVNGFNAGRGFAGPRDIVGIESLEVLKGPRSALFGRGEPGGTVNLVTKRPQFETKGDIKATLGRWNQMRIEGDFQSTTKGANDENNAVGWRLVGFYEDAESFRETVETERVGFYPSVSWDLSDATNMTYELEYTRQDIPFDRGAAYSPQFGFTPRSTFSGEPGDGPIETEVLGHQVELQHNFSDSWSLLAGLGYRDTSFEGNASEPNFGSRQTYLRDGRNLSRFFRYRNYESDYSVARIELAGEFTTNQLSHRFIAGIDYDRFNNQQLILRYRPAFIPADTDLTTLDPAAYLFLDVLNPIYGESPQPIAGPNTDREERLKGIGVYLQDQIELTDRLQLRLGVRWDDFEQQLTNLRAVPAAQAISANTRVSPQLGFAYAVNQGLSIYGSFGEGFRQQTGSDFRGGQFEPNVTESIEIGLKLDLATFNEDVSGTVTIALFDVDQSNILVNDARPEAVAAGFFSVDAGEAESQGIEIDASLSTDSGLDLWFSYAYTDAVFTNSNPSADFGAIIEVGDPLINSPEHQASLQISKQLTLAGMATHIGSGIQYTGERLGWTAFDFTLPSYSTVRFFGEIAPSERVKVRLDIDNAFDREYYTNSYADVWVGVGTPRRYRLTASYQF